MVATKHTYTNYPYYPSLRITLRLRDNISTLKSLKLLISSYFGHGFDWKHSDKIYSQIINLHIFILKSGNFSPVYVLLEEERLRKPITLAQLMNFTLNLLRHVALRALRNARVWAHFFWYFHMWNNVLLLYEPTRLLDSFTLILFRLRIRWEGNSAWHSFS